MRLIVKLTPTKGYIMKDKTRTFEAKMETLARRQIRREKRSVPIAFSAKRITRDLSKGTR